MQSKEYIDLYQEKMTQYYLPIIWSRTAAWFQEGQSAGPSGLWYNDLIGVILDTQFQHSRQPLIYYTGIFIEEETLRNPDLVYATDASGGKWIEDPRLRRVGVSVLALKREGDELLQVGSITAQVPGKQVVFRGGTYVVALLLQLTTGAVAVILDRGRTRSRRYGPTSQRKILSKRATGPI